MKLWSIGANHTRGFLAVGGILKVEDGMLCHAPNAFERLLGRGDWSVPMDQIKRITEEPRVVSPANLFSGGLTNRLAVVLPDDTREFFVVPSLNKTRDELSALVAQAKDGTLERPGHGDVPKS